jgi:hypothetical protein
MSKLRTKDRSREKALLKTLWSKTKGIQKTILKLHALGIIDLIVKAPGKLLDYYND